MLKKLRPRQKMVFFLKNVYRKAVYALRCLTSWGFCLFLWAKLNITLRNWWYTKFNSWIATKWAKIWMYFIFSENFIRNELKLFLHATIVRVNSWDYVLLILRATGPHFIWSLPKDSYWGWAYACIVFEITIVSYCNALTLRVFYLKFPEPF